MSAPRRSRKSVPRELLATWNWPEPETSGWDIQGKQRYHRFKGAICAYLSGEKIQSIEKRFDLHISQVQEQLARALLTDIEGRILGFCALVRSLHVHEQTRRLPLPVGPRPSGSSCKGALIHILRSESLYEEFEARVLGKSKSFKSAKLSAHKMQEWVRDELVERGYRVTDYPFTTKRPLYHSIWRLINTIRNANISDHVKAYGTPQEAANLNVMNGKTYDKIRPPPLLEVEIDEHKLHSIGTVKITLDGITKQIPGDRAVGISICDRNNGAVLGGAVCLNPEAKADTLIEAIRTAVIPGYVVTLPSGLPAPPFRPGDIDPSLCGLIWSVAYLDNAKIHIGDKYLVAEKRLGTQSCYGPLASWSARPNIEGIFRRIVRNTFGELMSNTSANSDFRPGNSPAEHAVTYDMTYEKLCEIFYKSLAQINTRVNSGILNQTPIDILIDYLKSPQKPILRRLPPISAANPEIGVQVIEVSLRRRGKDNPNLYVSSNSNKYSNERLSRRHDLLGQKITIHVSTNLQTVEAFEANGKPLGTLTADGFWGRNPHTRDIKRAAERNSEFRFAQHPDAYISKNDTAYNPVLSAIQKHGIEVFKLNEKRKPGKIVKGALKLQKMMASAGIEELHITTPPPSPQSPQTLVGRTLTSAAERAKQSAEALNRLKIKGLK